MNKQSLLLRNKVFLGLGANVGDRERNINSAIEFLQGKVHDIKVASIYESKPVGYKNQANFLNTALMGFTDLSPLELLNFIKQIEVKVGRVKRLRWGPREIDIDILFYEDLIYQDNSIQIPHPRLQERDFVLKPLLDLESKFIHPVFKKSLSDLYSKLETKELSIF